MGQVALAMVCRATSQPQGLACRAQFLEVQARGRRQQGHLLTLLVRGDTGGPARVGLTVSRRVGKAVVRNRVRRRLRELVRALGERWPAASDAVVVAHPTAATVSSAALGEELGRLLQRALLPISARGGSRRPARQGR